MKRKNNGTMNASERALQSWLHHAGNKMSPSPATAGMTNDPQRQAGLYGTLFPASPVIRNGAAKAPCRIASEEIQGIADYQMACIDRALIERLHISLGVASERVVFLNIQPQVFDYSTALARRASRIWCTVGFKCGLEMVRRFASRIWDLNVAGVTQAAISNAEVEQIYKDNWERVKQGSENFGISIPKIRPKPQDCGEKVKPTILVLLGVLPHFDAIEQDALNAANLVKTFAGAGGNEATNGPRNPVGFMSFAAYWDAYRLYLEKRAQLPQPEPPSPARYRVLLDARQAVRDFRLQCLQAYTGLRRVKALENDMIAGNQPIFFRLAELMLEKAGMGVASFVAAPDYLSNPDMTGMRKSMIGTLSRIAIDEVGSLNDDITPSRRQNADTGKTGATRPSTKSSALSVWTMMRGGDSSNDACEVMHQGHPDVKSMLASLARHRNSIDYSQYVPLSPTDVNGYPFIPPKVSKEYLTWPSLLDIAAMPPLSGLMEKRQGGLIDIDRQTLTRRMQRYFDENIPWAKILAMKTGLSEPQSNFDPEAVRRAALADHVCFNEKSILPYATKPFDVRWCYHSTVKFLWSDPKPNFASLCGTDNAFLVARAGKVMSDEGVPFFFTTSLGDSDLLRGHAYYFPLWQLGKHGNCIPNLSEKIRERLYTLDVSTTRDPLEQSRRVWNHVLAIAFSPAYLHENAEGITQEWPRIPFPKAADNSETAELQAVEAFQDSCRLGGMVADLLNFDAGVDGVTQGEIRLELKDMGMLWDIDADDCFIADESATIPVTMEWGKRSREKRERGDKGAVLPSHGRQWSRDLSPAERLRLEEGGQTIGLHAGAVYACLGEEFYELYLNEKIAIRNLPAKVYDFTVGGYPVLRKWLSYRETSILGRPLAIGEVQVFTEMVRRIAALLLLTPCLNRNYAVIRDLHPALS